MSCRTAAVLWFVPGRLVRIALPATRVMFAVLWCSAASVLSTGALADELIDEVGNVVSDQSVSGAVPFGPDGGWLGVTHTAGDGVGYDDDGFTTFHGFLPIGQGLLGADSLTFLAGGYSLTNFGESVANAGVGHRVYIPEWDRYLGGSLFYGLDDGTGRTFHSVGIGLETRGENWDFYTNVYIPVGDVKRRVSTFDSAPLTGGTPTGVPLFRGNGLFATSSTLRTRTTIQDAALTGLDMEFGGPPPVLGQLWNPTVCRLVSLPSGRQPARLRGERPSGGPAHRRSHRQHVNHQRWHIRQ